MFLNGTCQKKIFFSIGQCLTHFPAILICPYFTQYVYLNIGCTGPLGPDPRGQIEQ